MICKCLLIKIFKREKVFFFLRKKKNNHVIVESEMLDNL